MAAPFDASNASIFGDYIQLSGSGTAAPTGSSRGLSFIFASSSNGTVGDTALYLVNAGGSVSKIATEADAFNFTVAGDSGANQSITDGNTLTLAGGDGMASVASATDTVTFKVDIQGTTHIGAAVADADTLLIDDGNGGTIRRIDRGAFLTSSAISSINIDGGTIDNTVIGGSTAVAGTFVDLVATETITLTPKGTVSVTGSVQASQNISASVGLQAGTLNLVSFASNWTNASRTVADLGTITTVDINGGTADNVVIGGATPAAGTFTALVANGNVDLGDATSDTITATGRFDSDLTPSTDNARNLGASTLSWNEGYIKQIKSDGTVSVSGSVQATQAISGAVSIQGGAGTLASLTMGDGNITNVGDINCDSISVDGAATGLNVDYSGCNTGTGLITLADNLASALDVKEGSNSYLTFRTANSTEGVTVHKDFGPGSDNAVNLGKATFRYATGHIVELHADQLGQALDGNSQNATGFGNLYGSAVSGSVSVQGGAGTLATLAVAGGSVSGDVALALPNDKDVKARAFVTYSERSIKTNIQPMSNALDTVKKMQGVTYDLRDSGKNEVRSRSCLL